MFIKSVYFLTGREEASHFLKFTTQYYFLY